MSATLRATRMELFKLRRTLVLGLALLTPVLMVALAGWIHLAGLRVLPSTGWAGIVQSDVLFWWGMFIVGPLVGLEAALLADLDHRGGHWTRIFALPVPRWSVYAGKYVVGVLLLGAAALILAVGAAALGMADAFFRPQIKFPLPIAWNLIVDQIGAAYLATWLLLAIELWVAVRWKGLATPCGLALLGAVVGLTLDLSLRSVTYASLFPWSMPFIAGTHADQNQLIATALGLIGGVVLAILGAWDVGRRDVG